MENPISILGDIKKALFLPTNRGPPHRPTDDEPAIVHLHPFSYLVLWFFSLIPRKNIFISDLHKIVCSL